MLRTPVPSHRVTLRVANEADVETLFDIRTSVRENHQSREELARIGVTPASVAEMLHSSSRAWIAEVEEEAVAFSMANAEEQTIFAVFVRPGFEGRGLGKLLLHESEEWLFEQGAEETWLTTSSDLNIRAHGFYLKLGWQQTGAVRGGELKYIKRR